MSYHRLFALSKKKVIITAGYKTLAGFGQDEFTEKKSRFICCAKHIETETEAQAFISEICKKHWDARHNVYAYVLREGGVKRFSDDGEPQGTAGMPVLNVIEQNELTDCVLVVTRYFGGILLGGGGLVRAYSHSAKLGIENAGTVTVEPCLLLEVKTDYGSYAKIESLVRECGGEIMNTDFADSVLLEFKLMNTSLPDFEKKLADITNGAVAANIIGESEIFIK